ncbi:hypothetical protein BC829DRAFT_486801 [Chytridium lagenaria]|nr:hypothetical protein BC829DRAFT_486801 [Chytridium lagenaria]
MRETVRRWASSLVLVRPSSSFKGISGSRKPAQDVVEAICDRPSHREDKFKDRRGNDRCVSSTNKKQNEHIFVIPFDNAPALRLRVARHPRRNPFLHPRPSHSKMNQFHRPFTPAYARLQTLPYQQTFSPNFIAINVSRLNHPQETSTA